MFTRNNFGTAVRPHFYVREATDRWRMYNLQLNGNKCNIDLANTPLNQGAPDTYDGFQHLLAGTGAVMPCLRMYHAIMRALWHARDTEDNEQRVLIQQIRQFLRDTLACRDYPYLTSTRVYPMRKTLHVITHHSGHPQLEYRKSVTLTRNTGILQPLTPELAPAADGLFGTNDLEEILEAHTWVTGHHPQLVHSRLREPGHRLMRLRVQNNTKRFLISSTMDIATAQSKAHAVAVQLC